MLASCGAALRPACLHKSFKIDTRRIRVFPRFISTVNPISRHSANQVIKNPLDRRFRGDRFDKALL
ncbi:hypothetical protein DO73_3597 [Burkholderia pseudomallei]|nr:hypothetical protein DO73_3597 [Burkholderia pseudomallei]